MLTSLWILALADAAESVYCKKCAIIWALSAFTNMLWCLCPHIDGGCRRCRGAYHGSSGWRNSCVALPRSVSVTKAKVTSVTVLCALNRSVALRWLLGEPSTISRTYLYRKLDFLFGTTCGCSVNFTGTYRAVICYGLSVLEACVVDPAFSNMAVFNNINNSSQR